QSVPQIVAKILRRRTHRLAGLDKRRHVDNGLNALVSERSDERRQIAGVAQNERGAGEQVIAVPRHERIVDHDLIAGLEQVSDDDAADVARPTGDEYSHSITP